MALRKRETYLWVAYVIRVIRVSALHQPLVSPTVPEMTSSSPTQPVTISSAPPMTFTLQIVVIKLPQPVTALFLNIYGSKVGSTMYEISTILQ